MGQTYPHEGERAVTMKLGQWPHSCVRHMGFKEHGEMIATHCEHLKLRTGIKMNVALTKDLGMCNASEQAKPS